MITEYRFTSTACEIPSSRLYKSSENLEIRAVSNWGMRPAVKTDVMITPNSYHSQPGTNSTVHCMIFLPLSAFVLRLGLVGAFFQYQPLFLAFMFVMCVGFFSFYIFGETFCPSD